MAVGELEGIVAALSNKPSASQITDALNTLKTQDLNKPTSDLLQVFNVLVSESVYDFHEVSGIDFKPVFSNYVGLSTLLSRLQLLAQSQSTVVHKKVLLDILLEALDGQQLFQTIYTAYPHKDVITLFCGSRLLSVVSSLGEDIWPASGSTYTGWLGGQLKQFEEIPPNALDRSFKLGYPVDLAALFLSEDLHKIKSSLAQLRPTQRSFIIYNFLRALETKGSVGAVAAVWQYLGPGSDDEILRVAASSVPPFSQKIQRACVLVVNAKNLEKATINFIETWGDKATLQLSSIVEQHCQTQVLLLCAARLEPAAARRVTQSAPFISAISNHLENHSERTRSMGTLVAEALSRRGGDGLRFEIEYDKTEWIIGVDETISIEQALVELQQEQKAVPEPTFQSDIEAVFNNEPQDTGPELKFDSDDEDPPEVVATPVYIKDLVDYLGSDDFAKVQSALSGGPALVKRKAQFGSEVKQYAQDVLRLAAGLTDKFNMDDFSQMRQNFLTSVVVADPTQAPEVSRLLVTGDYSLYQRTSLLSTLVLAAQQLAAYNSNVDVSKRLPAALHRAFISDVDALALDLQDKLVRSTRDQHESQLGPQVLRVSKKLMQEREKYDVHESKNKNMYSALAGRYFFFPLAAAWGRGTSMQFGGSYAPLLHAHWLKTMALLVYLAYPSNDMGDMVGEMVQIWLANRTETQAAGLEALYTSILAVCEVAGALLIQQWPREVSLMTEWAGKTWQSSPSDTTQKLGAAAVLKLQELQEQIQSQFTAFA